MNSRLMPTARRSFFASRHSRRSAISATVGRSSLADPPRIAPSMTLNGHTPSPADAPTRVRYSVLFLLCLLAMITYMDRAANGSARDSIMVELNEQQRQQKY